MKKALMIIVIALLTIGANAQSKKKMNNLATKISDEMCECFQNVETKIETEEVFSETMKKCALTSVILNYKTLDKYGLVDFNNPRSEEKFSKFMENVGIKMVISCESFLDLMMKFEDGEDGEQDEIGFPFSR